MSTTPSAKAKTPRSFGALLVALLFVALAGGFYLYVDRIEGNVPSVDELASLRPMLSELAKYRKLEARYTDADGDLIADAPTDPARLRDPVEIRFVGIPTDFANDPERGRASWKPLIDRLASETKKTVVFAENVKTFEDQLAALKDGSLHITAFSTGQVPRAVNTAGFVPLFCPSDEQGNFSYEMEIMVRADSPIQTPMDLRGKMVAFSAMSSNSGSRAPMVVLQDEFKMLPGRDYRYVLTGDQKASLLGVESRKFDGAAVANDYFRRVTSDPSTKLSADAFRSIYKSKAFPPLCFGVAHDLKPDLKRTIVEVLKTFTITGSGVNLREAKFAPVNYKLDWAFVREVDESLGRLPDAK